MSDPGQNVAGINFGDPAGSYFGQDFFVYSASFGNLAPAAVSTQNVQIQADSDFLWMESTFFGFMHGATAPFQDSIVLPVGITIQDSGAGRQLFSGAIPLSAIAGTGKQPFIMPMPRKFKSRSNISIQATNNDPTNTYDQLFMNFIGIKLFKVGN